MNRHTPHQMQFVLYSTDQLVSSNGYGFWSNTEGWVEFKEATRFTVSSVPTCNMPISEGLDAKWIMWPSARNVSVKGGTLQLSPYRDRHAKPSPSDQREYPSQ
jgi:hypothetical protein